MQNHWHNGRRQRSRSASPRPVRDWNPTRPHVQHRNTAKYRRSRSKSSSNHNRQHARWGNGHVPPRTSETPVFPSKRHLLPNESAQQRKKRSRSRSRSQSRGSSSREAMQYRNSQKYTPQQTRSHHRDRVHCYQHNSTHSSYHQRCASPNHSTHSVHRPHQHHRHSQNKPPQYTIPSKIHHPSPVPPLENSLSTSSQLPPTTQTPYTRPLDSQQPSEDTLHAMEAVSLEHLEAIRNIKIITSNEYLIPSSSQNQPPQSSQPTSTRRKALRPREDEDPSICYCTYPSLTERQQIDDKASDSTVMESLQRCNDVSCLNYATYVECSASCEAREFCRNKRLQQPEKFPSLEAFKTLKKGFGIRTKETIRQGRIVGEYVGEIIDQNELNKRLHAIGRHELNFYYLLLRPGVYIDARNRGSLTRFVNHSCDPNCKTEKWTVEGDTRIAVVALRDIEFGTELTFDYQWKALGSRQLACHCNSSNCSGFIGGGKGIDVVEESTVTRENGYFREPFDTERGSILIGTRLRLSRDLEVSSFENVIVRAFDSVSDAYCVEFIDENDLETHEESISLSEHEGRWHVFCPLEGLSTDQIEKQVFSIPKRRIQPPFPSKLDAKPFKNTISTSQNRRENGRTRHPNRLLTPQILVKGIPQRCSSRTLHQVMSIHAKTNAAMKDPIESLELFFFPNLYGWALVTFISSEAANCILEKLDHRPLFDSILSIQCVDREGIDAFYRAKERNAEEKPDMPTEAPDVTDTCTTPSEKDHEKALITFGQRLHWLIPLLPKKSDAHAHIRTRCIRLLLWIARKLKLDESIGTSAVMLFHRFLHFHGAHVDKMEYMAIGVLHIALKAHGLRYKWIEFVNAAYTAKGIAISWRITINDATIGRELRHETEAFRVFAAQITDCQMEILETLRYDIHTDNLYAICNRLTSLESDVRTQLELLLLEAFQCSVWMYFSVETIVQALICIANASMRRESLECVADARQVTRCLDFLLPILVHHWKHLESLTNETNVFTVTSLSLRQEIMKLAKECVWKAENRLVTPSNFPRRCDSEGLRIRTRDLMRIERVRKRGFIAHISITSFGPRELYLQPWPYRSMSASDMRYGVPAASLSELAHVLTLACEAPSLFSHFLGIVFPSDGTNASMDLQAHYLAFRQPIHTLASRLEAKKKLSQHQIRGLLHALLSVLAMCHSNGFVHRSITSAHVFLYEKSVHVGGFHAIRRIRGKQHILSDSERKEHLNGAWMHTCAPEVLLGSREFTWKADIWALGCLCLQLLDLKSLLLHGNSWTHQMDLIFRLCGTPKCEWKDAMTLSKYATVTPKIDGNSRLQSLLETAKVDVEMIEMLCGMLQLDPNKRFSAEKLLQFEFMRSKMEPFTFSDVETTFSTAKKKMRPLIRTSKKKEKRTPIAIQTEMTPPLPTLLRHTSSPGACTQSKPSMTRFSSQERRSNSPDKRVKLGWGMGLHSH